MEARDLSLEYGLGLPVFILFPIIGTFSPLNWEFMIKQGVAFDLDTDQKAINFAETLAALVEDGSLLKAARNGYDKFDINGFEAIADYLKGELT